MRNRSLSIFGVLALIAAVVLLLVLQSTISWAWYWNWLVATGVVAFALYGFDKLAAKAGTARVPELLFHLLALAGGFGGALLGILVFRHKSNFRVHPLFLPLIILSMALWGFLIYWFGFRG